MGIFFRGWRRKLGLITLVLAMALFVCWGRSFTKVDRFRVAARTFVFHRICAVRGALISQRVSASVPSTWSHQFKDEAPAMFDEYAEGHAERTFSLLLEHEDPIAWDWQFAGLGRGLQNHETSSGTLRQQVTALSYWWLITPLTLLSGWLILTASQSRPQTKHPRINASSSVSD